MSMCSICAFQNKIEMNFVDKSFWDFLFSAQVECWNSLDGKTVELSSWVQGSDSAQIANNTGILKYTISQKHQFADEIN